MLGHPQIHLLDTVALVCDLPEFGLAAGEVGTVVEVYAKDAFEIEFCDDSGQTYGLHTLQAHQLIPLHTKGEPLRAPIKAA